MSKKDADQASFTLAAAAMVKANDRRDRWRRLLRHLRPAAGRVTLAWSALVIAAFVLVLLPVNMRMA